MIQNLKKRPPDWVGNAAEFAAGWWIKDKRLPYVLYIGPYTTKAEATEAKRGQAKFWKSDVKRKPE